MKCHECARWEREFQIQYVGEIIAAVDRRRDLRRSIRTATA